MTSLTHLSSFFIDRARIIRNPCQTTQSFWIRSVYTFVYCPSDIPNDFSSTSRSDLLTGNSLTFTLRLNLQSFPHTVSLWQPGRPKLAVNTHDLRCQYKTQCNEHTQPRPSPLRLSGIRRRHT
jgi:hypothetical protein